jgi:hypothetical protein
MEGFVQDETSWLKTIKNQQMGLTEPNGKKGYLTLLSGNPFCINRSKLYSLSFGR